MGLVRSELGLGLLAATTLALGCAAPVESDDWEPVDESSQALTKTVKASLVKKWSNAKRYRAKGARYIVCTEQPFSMAYMFKNTGSATWRDVGGVGETVGSDVHLVTDDGKPDELTNRTYFSVRGNKNPYVRGDRKAGDCSSKKGCRKTVFNEDGLWMLAPEESGIYATRWRLRDFSDAWKVNSKAFGPKVGLRFAVTDCQPSRCGCTAWCTDGTKLEPAAGAEQCKGVGLAMCEEIANATLLTHRYEECFPSGSGGTGSGGSGGSGSGGSGTGGNGTGGNGGTSPTPPPPLDPDNNFTCGSNECHFPDILSDVAEPCCYSGNACGYSSSYTNGQCEPLNPPEDLEGGIGPDPDELDLDPPDDPKWVDPEIVDGPSRGGVSEGGGCAMSSSHPSGVGLAALALLGLFAGVRRRRR